MNNVERRAGSIHTCVRYPHVISPSPSSSRLQTPSSKPRMALEIAPSKGSLPTASPNLMPFHIEYTGPAPISRYFRPKSVPTSDATRDLTTTLSSSSVVTLTEEILPPGTSMSESQGSITSQTSVATSVTVVEVVDPNPDETISATQVNATGVDVGLEETQPIDATPEAGQSSGSEQRLIAAFRGRQIVGRSIDLPSGYGGLVLQVPSLNDGKGKDATSTVSDPKPRSKVNAKLPNMWRSSRKSRDVEGDVPMEEEAGSTEEDPGDGIAPQDVRQLIPTSTFSSFTIWSPDIPVDEGKDEYIRCLVEWTKLAAEVFKSFSSSCITWGLTYFLDTLTFVREGDT